MYNYQSPYLYAGNNPIRYTDYLGLGKDDEVKKNEVVSEEIDQKNETATITERTITSNTEEGGAVVDENTGNITTTSTTTVSKTVSRTTINANGDIEHSESVTYSASQKTTTVKDKDGNIVSSTKGDVVKNDPVAGNAIGESAQKFSEDLITSGLDFGNFVENRRPAVRAANAWADFQQNKDKRVDRDNPFDIKNVQIKKLQKDLLKERRLRETETRRADSLQNIINKMQ